MENEHQTEQEVVQMPMMSRSAPVSTVNEELRTADLVFTTGAGVRRYDCWNERYYTEELSLDPKHVRMERLQSGSAPLLNTHSRWSLDDVIGVIESASLTKSEGVATVRFSGREDVQPIFQDVKDKIIRNVSVGYSIHAIERIPPKKEGESWIYRAIDWEPTEISLVPIGADAGSGVRSEGKTKPDGQNAIGMQPCKFHTRSIPQPPAAVGNTRKEVKMGDETKEGGSPAANTAQQSDIARQHQQELERAREEGARIESERQAGIREAVRLGSLDASFADQLIAERSMTAADAGMAVLREQARRSAAAPTRSAAYVETVSDETDRRRAAMGDAITLRANPNPSFRRNEERMGAARQYRGMTLMDMARECIEAAGGNVRGMSRREIAQMALNLERNMQVRAGMASTSDFPEIPRFNSWSNPACCV